MTSFWIARPIRPGCGTARPMPNNLDAAADAYEVGKRKTNYRKQNKNILNTYVFPPVGSFVQGYTCACLVFSRKHIRDADDHYGNTSRTITILLCRNRTGTHLKHIHVIHALDRKHIRVSITYLILAWKHMRLSV